MPDTRPTLESIDVGIIPAEHTTWRQPCSWCALHDWRAIPTVTLTWWPTVGNYYGQCPRCGQRHTGQREPMPEPSTESPHA